MDPPVVRRVIYATTDLPKFLIIEMYLQMNNSKLQGPLPTVLREYVLGSAKLVRIIQMQIAYIQVFLL